MNKPATFYRSHWSVTDEVKHLGCGRTWRKGNVVINACVKWKGAYVVITAPNKYWPTHGRYMYTYMETPFEMLDRLIDELYRIAKELDISVGDVRNYLLDRSLVEMRRREQKKKMVKKQAA
jgi:hypothetical protein